MITALLAIAEHFIGANFSLWLYVLPVLLDLEIIHSIDRSFQKTKNGRTDE